MSSISSSSSAVVVSGGASTAIQWLARRSSPFRRAASLHLEADVLRLGEPLLRVVVAHELEAEQETLPADVADSREPRLQRAQPCQRLLAAGGGVRHHVEVAHLLQRREADRARDGVAGVRVAGCELDPGRPPEGTCQPVGDHRRRQRDVPAGQALPEHEDVRPGVGELGCEEAAGAAEAGDDLVEDEDDVVPVAQGPERREVVVRRDHDAGGHQDRLGDQGGDRLGAFELDHLLDEPDVGGADLGGIDVEGWAVGVGRVEMDEAGRERLVRAPARAPAARRQCVARHPVIGAVVREHLVLAGIAGLAVELAGHLDRGLDRLRAAAPPLERRVLGRQEREELSGELEAPVARRHRRRGEGESRELSRRGLDEPRVPVPEAEAERAGEPVEVPAPVHVPDADPVALGQDQRLLAERLHLGEVDHHPADVVTALDRHRGHRCAALRES